MRLWSLHPSHLDRQGLTALWREALLAQAVLAGRTKGYRSHPQLHRFQATNDPLGHVVTYLDAVRAEATARGYSYDPGRIDDRPRVASTIPVTTAQLDLEWQHLGAKLAQRSPEVWQVWRGQRPTVHPLFHVVDGPIEPWERAVRPERTGSAVDTAVTDTAPSDTPVTDTSPSDTSPAARDATKR